MAKVKIDVGSHVVAWPHRAEQPAGLAGLLFQLPKDGESWTEEERAKFLHAFTLVLDFTISVEGGAADRKAAGESGTTAATPSTCGPRSLDTPLARPLARFGG